MFAAFVEFLLVAILIMFCSKGLTITGRIAPTLGWTFIICIYVCFGIAIYTIISALIQ